MPDPLYVTDGDRFVPTAHTAGPWDPRAQHGGPPAALLARAVEAVPTDSPTQVARLTYELLRPVPLTPLASTTEVVRPGRKVQVVQGSLHAEDVEVVRVTALRIRTTAVPVPEGGDPAPTSAGEALGSRQIFPGPPDEGRVAFHVTGMEIAPAEGAFGTPGPAAAWFRLRRPVVDDEEPSPLCRVAAAADFGNGISWVLSPERFLFINPDLTIHLARPAEGEWIHLDSRTVPGPQGAGLAESALSDRRGRIGRSVQSLLIDER